jgi:glycosyltransferase involved in cell wall biosynthesis
MDGRPAPHSGLVGGDTDLRYSVIVPVHNGAGVIDRCLDCLANQTVAPGQYEIIVVDDGSIDDTIPIVQRWADNHPGYAVTLFCQQQTGPAGARNLGAKAARGSVLLFTDADCRVVQHWIEVLVKPFVGSDQPVGLMGTYLSDQESLVARFVQVEFEDRYRRIAAGAPVDLVPTNSAAFRRDIFLAEGGFDASFPEANNEDVEFSYRLSNAGHQMVFVPQAQVYHQHPSDWRNYALTKMGRGYWRTRVYRRYPRKVLKDTYTPQVLKAQILLAPLLPLGIAMALMKRSLGWLLLPLPFLATTISFVRLALRRDPPVALVAPLGLWLRSVAFAVGIARALLSPFPGDRPGDE